MASASTLGDDSPAANPGERDDHTSGNCQFIDPESLAKLFSALAGLDLTKMAVDLECVLHRIVNSLYKHAKEEAYSGKACLDSHGRWHLPAHKLNATYVAFSEETALAEGKPIMLAAQKGAAKTVDAVSFAHASAEWVSRITVLDFTDALVLEIVSKALAACNAAPIECNWVLEVPNSGEPAPLLTTWMVTAVVQQLNQRPGAVPIQAIRYKSTKGEGDCMLLLLDWLPGFHDGLANFQFEDLPPI